MTAAEAKELGIVFDISPTEELLERAEALAKKIAANAPLAVQASKRMMRMGMDESFNDHVHRVFLQLLPLLKTEDFREGMKAFIERRAPDFKGK